MLLIWYYLLTFSTALIAVVISIPVVRKIALSQGYVDRPDARKVHHQPIVRIGGVSICLGIVIALAVAYCCGSLSLLPAEAVTKIQWVIFGSLGFFIIGLTDDLLGLSPLLRLVVQAGVSSFVWQAGVRIEFLTFPEVGIVHLGWLSLPITIIWLTGVVNAVNWIDGLDGLASGVCGIAASFIFIVCLFTGQYAAAFVMLALTGSLLGFLYYNFNPAQIFMGDGGSYLIGFMIAGVSIVGLVKSAVATAILVPFLILAVPILDMSAVIVLRLYHGKSPFLADKRHLHHRLLRFGLSHRSTVCIIYSLAVWVGSFAIVLVGIPYSLMVVSGATGLLGFTTWQAWQSVQHQS